MLAIEVAYHTSYYFFLVVGLIPLAISVFGTRPRAHIDATDTNVWTNCTLFNLKLGLG